MKVLWNRVGQPFVFLVALSIFVVFLPWSAVVLVVLTFLVPLYLEFVHPIFVEAFEEIKGYEIWQSERVRRFFKFERFRTRSKLHGNSDTKL